MTLAGVCCSPSCSRTYLCASFGSYGTNCYHCSCHGAVHESVARTCVFAIPPLNESGLSTSYLNLDCRDGKFVREIAYLPLAEDIPVAFNSCRKGPRSIGWRDDKPAELYWAEAQVRRSPGLPCTAGRLGPSHVQNLVREHVGQRYSE